MFGFGKKKRVKSEAESPEGKRRLVTRLKEGLALTRAVLNTDVGDLISGRKRIDEALFEELETLLLTADVGVEATTRIIDDLSG